MYMKLYTCIIEKHDFFSKSLYVKYYFLVQYLKKITVCLCAKNWKMWSNVIQVIVPQKPNIIQYIYIHTYTHIYIYIYNLKL